jgi:hypothetical protein
MIESYSTGPALGDEVSCITVRTVRGSDYAGWRPLWDGYNAFYGRQGETALPESITATTWERFFEATAPYCNGTQDVRKNVMASSRCSVRF